MKPKKWSLWKPKSCTDWVILIRTGGKRPRLTSAVYPTAPCGAAADALNSDMSDSNENAMSDDHSQSNDSPSPKKGFFTLILNQLFHGEPKTVAIWSS